MTYRTVCRFSIRALAALALTSVLTSAAAAAGESFSLSLINGVHTNLSPDVAPVRRGPVTINVSSPSHRLAVHRNDLRLTPTADGRIAAEFSIDFEGEGHLVADIDAGMSSTFEDEVVVPRQTLELSGLIRLRRGEGGYDIVLDQMPAAVAVAIESQALTKIVDLCAGFARILPLSCDGLANELGNAEIPLPGPGETVFLPDSYLSAAERVIFDRFVTID